jgi:hypothetical protein
LRPIAAGALDFRGGLPDQLVDLALRAEGGRGAERFDALVHGLDRAGDIHLVHLRPCQLAIHVLDGGTKTLIALELIGRELGDQTDGLAEIGLNLRDVLLVVRQAHLLEAEDLLRGERVPELVEVVHHGSSLGDPVR